jgi:hypothetical protein
LIVNEHRQIVGARQINCRASFIWELCIMRPFVLAALALVASSIAAHAASCSDWKATCESRGGAAYCEAQFAKCLKTGSWTEGAKFGGATHSGLTKK